MNDLKIFENQEFGKIRAVEIDGEPWFVGKDVALALGYKDTINALKAHVDDEDKRGGWRITTPSGVQEMTVINESGLYSLVLSSKLPTAKKFKRWVTSEVLPSIRRTGGYILPKDYPSALRALADSEERRIALEAENKALAPKAEYFDDLVERNLLTGFRETAKEIGAKPKQFVKDLLDGKYIYRDGRGKLMPYQNHVDDGLFELKESKSDRNSWAGTQTLITPKGRETFRLLFCIKKIKNI